MNVDDNKVKEAEAIQGCLADMLIYVHFLLTCARSCIFHTQFQHACLRWQFTEAMVVSRILLFTTYADV
jgi:hypothetical protein